MENTIFCFVDWFVDSYFSFLGQLLGLVFSRVENQPLGSSPAGVSSRVLCLNPLPGGMSICLGVLLGLKSPWKDMTELKVSIGAFHILSSTIRLWDCFVFIILAGRFLSSVSQC